MESKLTLPCSIAELQKMDIDWKAVTNGFDFYKVNDIIRSWKEYEERRVVAGMIGSQISVDNLNGISSTAIQPVIDLVYMYQYREGSDKYKMLEKLASERLESYKWEEMERLKEENKRLKTQVEKLKEELKAEEELVAWRTRLTAECECERNRANEWRLKFENEVKENEKLEYNISLLKELVKEKGADQKFSVRQTAIVAYALCRKADVLPKNKKSISPLFNYMTGRSANTLGQNLCSSYTDKEIEEIATIVEKEMPEFAAYLREKTFYLPEKKK